MEYELTQIQRKLGELVDVLKYPNNDYDFEQELRMILLIKDIENHDLRPTPECVGLICDIEEHLYDQLRIKHNSWQQTLKERS